METPARWSFVFSVVACGATDTMPADAGAPASDARSNGDSASPSDAAPAVDAGTGPGASCASPGDCRLYSDDCGGCTCVPLHAGAPDPACNGTKVSCFVDPCEGKSAACVSGACAAQ